MKVSLKLSYIMNVYTNVPLKQSNFQPPHSVSYTMIAHSWHDDNNQLIIMLFSILFYSPKTVRGIFTSVFGRFVMWNFTCKRYYHKQKTNEYNSDLMSIIMCTSLMIAYC